MEKILLIIGGESTGLEIRELVDQYYSTEFDKVYNVVGKGECPYAFITDEDVDALANKKDVEVYYIISMSNHKLRTKFTQSLQEKGIKPYNVIHPNATVSKSAILGKNIYIAAHAVVSSFAKIEDDAIINFGAIVGHDVTLGQNCVLNPRCQISGFATLEENILVGAGTVIKQGVTIGKNTLIDAMCYIDKNIAESRMCTTKRELKEFKNIYI